MPEDGTLLEEQGDARLIRAVRWRLVAFSGGSTLLVLVVLGLALYLSVATSLAASSTAVLDDRAGELAGLIRGEPPQPGGAAFDFAFGGNTFGIAVDPTGVVYGPRQFSVPAGLPDSTAFSAAKATGRDVRTTVVTFQQLAGPGVGTRAVAVPVRQLTVPVNAANGQ